MSANARTYRDLLAVGRARLEAVAIETAALDAALLLAHAAGLTRTALYARLPEDATPPAISAYEMLLAARVGGIPVAYLRGEKEFLGLMFAVTPATLVPRPETELLVEWAVQWLSLHRDEDMATAARIRAIDVGTGSGAIAVSLTHQVSDLMVAATDISDAALRVARANALRHGVAHHVALVRGDLLPWLGQPVPLILANLPYLTDVQADDAGIAAEPRIALAGGERDGFAAYRRLIPQVAGLLTPGGAFAFEVDPTQITVARDACRTAFPDAKIMAHHDLAALPRFISVEKYR